jgi:activator of the mannose operon (transcriptional antiterminator)
LRLTNPLLTDIKRMYRYTFETLISATASIAAEIGGNIPEDEIGYLTLHFQAALERSKGKQAEFKKALLVCTTGVGTSLLLAAKIKRFFPELHLVDSVSVSNLAKSISRHEPDLLISTVPLKNQNIPVVSVTPLFNKQDHAELERILDELSQNKMGPNARFPVLHTLLFSELIQLDLNATNRFEAIDRLASELLKRGYVYQGYAKSAWAREQVSSTYIGGGVAIPHGLIDFIQKSAVAVARLKQPINWDGNQVFLIFMPAVKLSEKETAERMFAELAELVENPVLLHALRKAGTVQEFLAQL